MGTYEIIQSYCDHCEKDLDNDEVLEHEGNDYCDEVCMEAHLAKDNTND